MGEAMLLVCDPVDTALGYRLAGSKFLVRHSRELRAGDRDTPPSPALLLKFDASVSTDGCTFVKFF